MVQVVLGGHIEAAPLCSMAKACPGRCASRLPAMLPGVWQEPKLCLSLLCCPDRPHVGQPQRADSSVPCVVKQLLPSHLAIGDGRRVSKLGAALAIGSVVQRDSPACPGSRAPLWKCPSLLSSLQQTCLHCSLTFFFLYFYFCMSFAFQIL